MNSYAAFVYSGLSSPSGAAAADGRHLAARCLAQLRGLGDAERFPPRLLILLASPAYLELHSAKHLLSGIEQVFRDAGLADRVPLVGTSVAAVFFDDRIHRDGALLVCLASLLVDAKVGVGKHASLGPEAAVGELLKDLNLNDTNVDLNPASNRMLLTFFPDISRVARGPLVYRSDELHGMLWRRTLCRIPIAGGISSAGAPRAQGATQPLQFYNWEIHSDAVVAAQVDSGVPLGVSLCRGLESVEDEKGIVRRRVSELSEDGRYITAFDEGPPDECLNDGDGLLLLAEDSKERDLIMAASDPADRSRVKVTDKISAGETFRVLRPHPEQLLTMAGEIVQRSNERVRVRHPLGCLSLICSSHYRDSREHVSLYIEQAIKNIEDAFDRAPCVGGFVDGEAGVDETGRSQFGNWSMVGLILGDGMRDRTPLYRGFGALAKYSHRLNEETTIEDAVAKSLELVYETDFPGVMISAPLPDQEQDYLIVQGTKGARFQGMTVGTGVPITGGDALAHVLLNKQPRFLKEPAGGGRGAGGAEKYVGQYIVPLKDISDEIIAIMHVDLGVVDQGSVELRPVEREVLDSLGAAIAAGLNDILNWRAGKIVRDLDRGLKESISARNTGEGLQCFVEAAVGAFKADMGHVRLARPDRGTLELKAGVGEYYEAARERRAAIALNDVSPTCEAYFSGGTTVVNDAWNNAAHNRLRETVREDTLKDTLRMVRSYANTAFKNQEGKTIGTINLLSKKPWFFTRMHKSSLEALAERIEFLVEHLKQKENKAEAYNGIEFLRHATPQLAHVGINDMPGALRDATERFCNASRADIASLYLFDADTGKYVLRAQHNWAEGEHWVNVARYERDGGWLWNVARQPEPSAQVFRSLSAAEQLYAAQMFGDQLDERLVVSGAGLPLTLGGKNLGLLALYAKHAAGARIATINPKDLEEAASSMAALVRILLFSEEKTFGEKMQRQFKSVSDIFLRDGRREVLEESLCKYVAEMFGAATADFYFFPRGDAQELGWVAGYPSPGDRGGRPRPEPDATALGVSASQQPIVFRHGVPTEEHKDYESAAADGLVTRLCIPVIVRRAREGVATKPLTGVLDVRWEGPRAAGGWEIVHHSEEQLRIMGTVIGSAYNKYRLTAEKEEARKQREEDEKRDAETIQVVSDMRAQAAHVTGNVLNVMKGVPGFIRAEKTVREREEYARKLDKVIVDGSAMVKEILDSAQGMMNVNPRPCSLKPILDEAVERVTTMLFGLENGQEIKISVEVPDSIGVYIDDRLTKQVFFNLICNAIEATEKKMHGEAVSRPPRITASVVAQEVEILIEDRGVGLTHEHIEAAMKGKLKTPGKTGSGVFFSRGFILRQRGTHDMFPNEYGGITVRVTLPLNQKEETDGNYIAGHEA